VWTTFAELSENDIENKVCLVFESTPVETLRAFVDEFTAIKNITTIVDNIPELSRISCSLVGKGVGPALIIETQNRTTEEKCVYETKKRSSPIPDEIRWTAAMRAFVGRMVSGVDIVPHSTDTTAQDPIAYRIIGSVDVCDIMSGYWTCVCELLSLHEGQISSIVVSYPPTKAEGGSEEHHNRYAAIAELMNRMLALYGTNSSVANFHCQPFYDRDKLPATAQQHEQPSHGHLPPTSWVQSQNGDGASFSELQLRLQNYQRRSPLPTVILERVSVSHGLGSGRANEMLKFLISL
jgi:hypothetical protein